MTDYSLKNTKTPPRDAFGTPLADIRGPIKGPARSAKTAALMRAVDKVARTISGREKPGW